MYDFGPYEHKKWQAILTLQNSRNGPVGSSDDKRLSFMENFRIWVVKWQEDNRGKKKSLSLTNDTFKPLIRTLAGVKYLFMYLPDECSAEFVLTAKISNDITEGRFGSYRGLSASSYLILLAEVFESQGKLYVIGYLRAHRILFGTATWDRNSTEVSLRPVSEQELVKWFRKNANPEKRFPEQLNG